MPKACDLKRAAACRERVRVIGRHAHARAAWHAPRAHSDVCETACDTPQKPRVNLCAQHLISRRPPAHLYASCPRWHERPHRTCVRQPRHADRLRARGAVRNEAASASANGTVFSQALPALPRIGCAATRVQDVPNSLVLSALRACDRCVAVRTPAAPVLHSWSCSRDAIPLMQGTLRPAETRVLVTHCPDRPLLPCTADRAHTSSALAKL